ncbi:MAG TPA: M2 family metallopeptidase, partial [Candidatus Aminicenantes bacterium]|nr:M2 family metallopeptidase [Candidatus Aminicenantes bacterium]
MKRIVCLAVLMALVAAVLPAAGGRNPMEKKLATFLDQVIGRIEPLSRSAAIASYDASISGREADYQKSAALQLELKKIQSDRTQFARLKEFRQSGKIVDPSLKRQLDLLYLAYLGNQVDEKLLQELVDKQTAIEQKFNVFRARIGDRTLSDNEVEATLKSSTDGRELEAVWKASKEIGRSVAADMVDLAKTRNRMAKSLGFADFYEMQLRLAEQDPADIAALFDELDSLTGDAFRKLKGEMDVALAGRLNVAVADLRPWHYQNRFFQEAPAVYPVDLDSFYAGRDPVAIAREYYRAIGLPVDEVLKASDLYEKPGKYQHAFSSDMDRLGDVRILCSVKPNYNWMNTLLHELGHGVYSRYHDPAVPWLLRDAANQFTTEAVAMFFGRLAGNPRWLNEEVGVPPAETAKVADACARAQRLEQLVFSRWAQVMVRFERAMYADPDQDLNKLWWDLVEKYQGLRRPENRNEPDWATKIHIALYPVYYHNYLMGE